MSLKSLLYVGNAVADRLVDNIDQNIDRYLDSGFEDLESQGNWRLPSSVVFDPDPLAELDPNGGAEADKRNSILVWRALKDMSPLLATENRVWIRFTHIECLEYSRARWLKNVPEENLSKDIKKHFFAYGRTGWRDDNAISRLWWNYWVAKRVFPDDPERALDVILHASDVRLSTVERPWFFTRIPVASAIVRMFSEENWLLEKQSHWRAFMTTLNIKGAGVLFEVMSEREIDDFMKSCYDQARSKVEVMQLGEAGLRG